VIAWLRTQLEGLIKVVNAVLTFIGHLWSDIVQYVNNRVDGFLSVIHTYALWAYGAAHDLVYRVKASIDERVSNIRNLVIGYAWGLYVKAREFVVKHTEAIVGGLRKLAQQAITLINVLWGYVLGQFGAILGDLANVWRWITVVGYGLYNIVKEWVKIFTPDNLSRFVYLVVNLFPSIFNFFNNPVDIITLWIEPRLLDWIFWLLAYELGTKEASLPTKPKQYG
jgi:phage-related protein